MYIYVYIYIYNQWYHGRAYIIFFSCVQREPGRDRARVCRHPGPDGVRGPELEPHRGQRATRDRARGPRWRALRRSRILDDG